MQGHATIKDSDLKSQLEDAISQAPNDYGSLVKLGALLFEPYHDPERAMEILQKAVNTAPDREDAWFWIAKCHFHYFFEPREALLAIENALKVNPNRADCLSLKASVLMELKAPYGEVLKCLDKCLTICPDWVTPRKEKVVVLSKMKRFEEAQEEIRIVSSLPPFSFLPKDSVEEYYEESVTGRSRPNLKEELLSLQVRVEGERLQRRS